MKPEILSPVGNIEMLYAAINGGCDAVYLAGKNFGARSFAQNFTNEELKEVITYSHMRNVKVYVTVNTLIYNDEVNEFIKYIAYLVKIKIDAVIMQDIGMINLVRKLFPNLEIHASTQSHNYNEECCKFLKNLGVKRVVAARECNLDTIKKMADITDIEIFVYGALCVSYSGCCLFSSLNGGRSGNRGECVGNCRMAYKLDNDKNYLYHLSMQDLNVIEHIDEILKTNVKSLKIEGRMKSPLYVGYVTSIFRKLIDNYYEGNKYILSKEEQDNLKKLFYRGFTTGYLFNNEHLTNNKYSNHQGLKIGNVINITPKYIKIKLYNDLHQNDGIRFLQSKKGMIVNFLYDKNLKLIKEAHKNDIIYLDNKIDLTSQDDVSITLSNILLPSEKQIPINIHLEAKINKPVKIVLDDSKNRVEVTGNIVEASINAPMTKENLTKHINKLGDTIYKSNNITIDMDDNIFISIKHLNDLRRVALIKLDELRTDKETELPIYEIPTINNQISSTRTYSITVRNEEQLKIALNYNFKRIYILNDNLFKKYQKYDNIYLSLPRVNDTYPDNLVQISENASINKYKEFIGNYPLNITNDHTIALYKSLNAEELCLSPENSIEKLKNYHDKSNEVLVYGRIELMAIKNNILNNNQGTITDVKNNIYPYYYDRYLHIMDCKNLDLRSNIHELKGFKTLRIDLYNETVKETKEIIESVVEQND